MQNIFEVGGQVSGESFIGRKAEIEKFRNEFLNSKKKKSIFSYRSCPIRQNFVCKKNI